MLITIQEWSENLWLVSKLFKEGAEGLERSEYTDNFYRS